MDNFELRERKLRRFPEQEGYLREKFSLIKNERSAYVSAVTKIVNKITRYITENSDVSKLQTHELKLQNAIEDLGNTICYIHDVMSLQS